MSKENPFPAKSFAVLALIGALYVGPRVIERTDTICEAVSSQVVNMMIAQVTETEMAKLISMVPGNPSPEVARDFVRVRLRHDFAEKVAPKLRLNDPSWYYCSTLYWVNFAYPPPAGGT